jgi:hypothetical protein
MRKLALLAAPFLAAGLLAGLPQTAHAAVDQTCAVTESVTYVPPLTNATQTITVTVNAQLTCSSSFAPTGSYITTFVQPGLSCNLRAAGSGSVTFSWTNTAAEPSVFTHNSIVTISHGTFQIMLLGSITSGTFTPAPAKEVLHGAQIDPTACSTTGISQQTFIGVLVIGG